MKKIFYLPVMMLTMMTACGPNQHQKNNDSMQSNPLLQVSSLPYGAPDFTQLKNEDFKPAIEEGMKEQMAEIDAIANNAEPATFENTLVALEKSGQTLSSYNFV